MRKVTVREAIFYLTIFYYMFMEVRYSMALYYDVVVVLRWGFPLLLLFCALGDYWSIGKPIVSYMTGIAIAVMLAALPSLATCIAPKEALARATSFSMVLICISCYLGSVNDVKLFYRLFLGLCIIACVFAIWNFFFVALRVGIDTERHRGALRNANTLGVYSNLAYVAACYILRRCKQLSAKIIMYSVMVISVVLCIACESRTAFAVCGLNIVISLLFFSNNKTLKKVFLISIPIIFVGLIVGIQYIGLSVVSRFIEKGFFRTELWQAGLDVFKENALFGVGYGLSSRFNTVYEGYAFHNSYLSYLIDVGIWGSVIFVLSVIPPMLRVTNMILNTKDTSFIPYVITMIIDIAFIGWGESFLFSIGSTEGFLFWVLVTILVTYSGKMTKGFLKDNLGVA